MNISDIINKQREFFETQKTKDLEFRKQQLRKLQHVLQTNEEALLKAIYDDFGKSKFDTIATELGLIHNDIKYYIRNIRKLSKPKCVSTTIANIPGTSKIHYDPLGVCLVIGAWNYPYQLSICPVIAAIAAGNCVILKPSEIAHHTMTLMAKLFNENFDDHFFYTYEGGIDETTELLKNRFDKIFFTGSPKVGQIVYEAASRHLTPVTLELGGKSPVIVTESSNLKVAAKRIVWGKFLNGGQTCIAPDYLFVHESVKEEFLNLLKEQISKNNYTDNCDHYPKIINDKNFDRLVGYINSSTVYSGGKFDSTKRYIEPTLLYPVSANEEVMKDEIFGPILPVLTYNIFDETLKYIRANEKPLSAYLFTNNSEEKEKFLENISFGGGCINDVIMHISNHNLPFGGVGQSGIGSYHGKFGFLAFSHSKAILNKATWGEPNIKYPPYTEQKLNLIKKVL